ncbi:hypothetical protein SAMN02745673_01759 [Marinactinospora thermotolerans DSM 45154]|uniref:Uncharacterized protein n=1 Tax=Marinactinospora thermotolerans DSM 45154 TaxID=1122192 RepID=A0A1T4PE08_9ACTN|nr:hypothetical protein SAMN02745673_01759 [Marinactinospora thermotolerans DSM 45154]
MVVGPRAAEAPTFLPLNRFGAGGGLRGDRGVAPTRLHQGRNTRTDGLAAAEPTSGGAGTP